MQAYILVRTLPLPRDYDEGEVVTMVECGTEIRMKLIENAFKGERKIKAIPVDEILH